MEVALIRQTSRCRRGAAKTPRTENLIWEGCRELGGVGGQAEAGHDTGDVDLDTQLETRLFHDDGG